MKRVVVVGAGISGLAAAHWLTRDAGCSVTVLEAGARAGGVIRSEWKDGILCEHAAAGVLDNAPDTVELVERLGLTRRWIPADRAAKKRYVVRRGRFERVPTAPPGFATSSVISWRGKVRLAMEPFIPRRADGVNETFWEFGARRAGAEAADVLMDAMAAGVFAGDARRMEVDSCFPRVRAWEKDHGSIFAGLIATDRQRRAEGRPVTSLRTFDAGMQVLVDALVTELGPALRLNTSVRAVEKGPPWRVVLDGGAVLEADHVVLTTPAPVTAELLGQFLGDDVAAQVRNIPYAPVDIAFHALDERFLPPGVLELSRSFGFLLPSADAAHLGTHILGTLFTRGPFPMHGRAGVVVTRTLLGGARNPQVAGWTDADARTRASQELGEVLGLENVPPPMHMVRWPQGIPQYVMGHAAMVTAVHGALGRHRGLHVAGNAFRGVGVNDTVKDTRELARTIARA